LTTWHCILSVELAKTHSFRLCFGILPTGNAQSNNALCFVLFYTPRLVYRVLLS